MDIELLEVGIKNADFYLQGLIPGLVAGDSDWKDIQGLCASFRQRGVCSLLLHGRAKPFFENAMQSSAAFAYFLPSCSNDAKRTSEAHPLYDALGAGYWDCAKVIARHSRETCNHDYEYEEDFLFVLFLIKHFFFQASLKECKAILIEHERIADGQESEKRGLCQSFLERDSNLFNKSLYAFLEQRLEEIQAKIKRGTMPEETACWRGFFSIEGIAFVRLAERLGLKTEPEYLHIPSIVRVENKLRFDPDCWRTK